MKQETFNGFEADVLTVVDLLKEMRGTELPRDFLNRINQIFWKMSTNLKTTAHDHINRDYGHYYRYFEEAAPLTFKRTDDMENRVDGFTNHNVIAKSFMDRHLRRQSGKRKKEAELELRKLNEDRLSNATT